jgi:hypothetical protein
MEQGAKVWTYLVIISSVITFKQHPTMILVKAAKTLGREGVASVILEGARRLPESCC